MSVVFWIILFALVGILVVFCAILVELVEMSVILVDISVLFDEKKVLKGLRGKLRQNLFNPLRNLLNPFQKVLRAMYMEHCDGPEATAQFESGYGFATCAKEEFECVVGEEGVDTKTWTLMKDAVPKVASKTGPRVRDARTLSEVLKSAEVEKAKLGVEEVVALRLLTGPMHELYNSTLRGEGGGAEDSKGVRFATTCLLISSGLPPPPPH